MLLCMELGLATFADLASGVSPQERMRQLLEEAELADQSRYDALRSPRGALAVGAPEEVAEKILFEHELFGMDRYVGQMSVGAVQHADVMRSIELFGTRVAPVVRAEVARRESVRPAA